MIKQYKVVAAGAIFLIALIWLWQPKIFQVRHIVISGNLVNCTDKEDILTTLKQLNLPIWSNSSMQIRQTLLNKYACLKKATSQLLFDGILAVSVDSRQPILALEPLPVKVNLALNEKLASDSALIDWSDFSTSAAVNFSIDKDGVVLSAFSGLPILQTDNLEFKLGSHIDKPGFSNIAGFVDFFSKQNYLPKPGKYRLQGKNLLVFSQPKIVFSLESEQIRQLASLQLILEKAKIDGKVVESIDLRFNKPVVVYVSR